MTRRSRGARLTPSPTPGTRERRRCARLPLPATPRAASHGHRPIDHALAMTTGASAGLTSVLPRPRSTIQNT